MDGICVSHPWNRPGNTWKPRIDGNRKSPLKMVNNPIIYNTDFGGVWFLHVLFLFGKDALILIPWDFLFFFYLDLLFLSVLPFFFSRLQLSGFS